MSLHLPKLERRPELDALRGLFLVWMTLTHLPTRFSDFVNQPIGFLSSAEGFVFMSALLVGRIYIREMLQDKTKTHLKLFKRSLKIYGYHLLLLVLAFSVAATYAAHMHKTALTNLFTFYLAHPGTAILGSVLLLYCPPLLDILPMYVIFLAFTPLVLSASVRFGWRKILAVSFTVWLLAQFGLREVVHNWIVSATHLHIPLQETGAFNLFAWQAIWIAGLWLGAEMARGVVPFKSVRPPVIAACVAICLFFIGVRHGWLGPHLTQQALGMELDKWSIGPLRVLNLISFAVVFYWLRKYVAKLVSREPFITLGKASLQVFCAHLFFVFVGLALLYGQIEQLHGWTAAILLAVTFVSLMIVALREVSKRNRKRNRPTPPPQIVQVQGVSQ
ncbi:MAG TPA: OpgC domain-containing protein [Acidobacteriaceae bacterium]|nr:OpgC domain-containing protein [Acidobacteriaceae bacterium]